MERFAGGLFCGMQRVPLQGVKISVRADGTAAKVTVAQRYRNDEKVAVEAVYSFPMDESSAVNGFEVEIAGKRIVGRVEERDAAFEKYDDAIAKGHGAFLMDQDRPNIFTASVGNLPPGQECVVQLSYVTELEQSKDAIRLLIPTTISPRYIPAEFAKKMDPSERDHLTPPTVAGGVPYGLELSVDWQAPSEIREVSCPSHPARVQINGRSARIELMGRNIQLDQDFVLNLVLAQAHQTSVLATRDGDGARAIMISLAPDLSKLRRSPCEFIFIIDRSGSMGGSSIEQARSALQLAVRSMEEGDYFNVIGFGSTFETMFANSVAYSQSSLDDATKQIIRIDANLGGTEILKPLTMALEAPRVKDIPRQIVLLTDGQVGNESECIALVAKHVGHCKIFAFGIGDGVSQHLIRALARASGGQAEFIQSNERIEPKVLRQFSRMASGNLKNVRMDWGDLKTDLVAPMELPPLFNGDRISLYARVVGGTGGEIAVLADGPDGTLRFPATVDLEKLSDESAIPVLMARKAIQELEEGRGAERGSAQKERKKNTAQQRILELALRYQIISSLTSFVAVEERVANGKQQAPELRRVPIALTKGWGSPAQMAPMMPPMMSMAAPIRPPGDAAPAMARRRAAVRGNPTARRAFSPAPPQQNEGSGITGFFKNMFGATGQSTAVSTNTGDPFQSLTQLQRADGSFALGEIFAELSGTPLPELRNAARKLNADADLAERIAATALALEILRKKFAAREDEWIMLAKKASRWLSLQKTGEADVEAWARRQVH